MNSVTPIDPTVKPTIDSACHWLRQKGERGELPATTARFKVTAIHQLVGVLADDEPRDDVQWVLSNVEAIAKRWATRNSGKYGAETIKTYESRARSGLEDYLRWLQDPAAFKFTRERDPSKPKAPREPRAPKSGAGPSPVPEDTATAADEGGGAMRARVFREFPLPGGRTFRFELPEGDLSVNDVRRIGLHLWTYAHDIDPMTPTDPFAIAKHD